MKQILFNTKMVRAILAGRKSQTRRPIKAPGNEYHYDRLLGDWGLSREPEIIKITEVDGSTTFYIRLPYQPGDILYVRETFADISETAPGNLHYKASATKADLE